MFQIRKTSKIIPFAESAAIVETELHLMRMPLLILLRAQFMIILLKKTKVWDNVDGDDEDPSYN